jgi:hypothetical protein
MRVYVYAYCDVCVYAYLFLDSLFDVIFCLSSIFPERRICWYYCQSIKHSLILFENPNAPITS